MVGVACQPPLVVEDGDGSGTSAPGTTTEDAPPVVSTTTSVEPSTSDSADPTVADGTSTGELPIPETCDFLEQDCPPGYKCTFYVDPDFGGYSGVRCVEVVDDPQAPLEPCSVTTWPPDGNDDCDATSYCYSVGPETMQGLCAAFCIGTPDDLHCADPCQYCRISGDADLPCLPSCDPLIDSCPDGQACYLVDDDFVCAPEGSAGGEPIGVGESCEFLNDCVSGTSCIDDAAVPGCPAGAFACCSPYCNPAAAFDPCPEILPGTECTPIFPRGDEPLPGCGYDPPGICAAP